MFVVSAHVDSQTSKGTQKQLRNVSGFEQHNGELCHNRACLQKWLVQFCCLVPLFRTLGNAVCDWVDADQYLQFSPPTPLFFFWCVSSCGPARVVCFSLRNSFLFFFSSSFFQSVNLQASIAILRLTCMAEFDCTLLRLITCYCLYHRLLLRLQCVPSEQCYDDCMPLQPHSCGFVLSDSYKESWRRFWVRDSK